MKPRILVIRGGAIGDFILTLPAIRLLRENFPQAHLEILGYKHIVAVAEGRYYADATRSIEYAGLSRFFMPNAERDPELVAWFASFQQVVSYLYDPDLFFEDSLREAGVKNFLAGPGRLDDSDHASVQLARPLERLALFLDREAPELFPSPADATAASAFLGEARPIALHPGSGAPGKNWPLERWEKLLDWLIAHRRDLILLFGGEADEERLQRLLARTSSDRLLVARSLPLPHVAALIQRSRMFIGHDSGITHIAAATSTPTLVLFGATDPAIWAPRNEQAHILRGPEGDLGQLEVNAVIAWIEEMAG